MTKTTQLIALTLLVLITLAMAPAFTIASPELQANTMYKVKTTTSTIEPNALGANHPYYAPFDIRAAYNIPTTGDTGTIAIIDAYDNPNVAADLTYFNKVFTWPAANLEVHKMSSFITANAGWALESDLDVQWAHAVAPDAKILLIEARTASIADLMAAVDYANTRSDVVAVSMSWGSSENSGQLSYDSHFTTTGKVYFASSGDVGGVVSWPSSSPNVVSVGGTSLIQTSTGYTESAWSNGGGGVSTIEQIPSYQATTLSNAYTKRATPDVSYNADPNNGFLVYDSYGYNGGRGWFVVGGTSAGAPQWAALSMYGNTANNINFYSTYPNSYGATFTDIQTGSNGYPTKVGYDLATGIGSPIGVVFGGPITPDFSLSAPPVAIPAGQTGTITVTATSLGGYNGKVDLELTDSRGWTISPTTGQIDLSTVGSGTAQFSVSASSVLGATDTITVNGVDDQSRSPSHSTTFTVTSSDFSVSASPSSINVPIGSQGVSSTITVTALDGFTGTVNLQLPTTLPTGFAATLSSNSVTIASGQTSGTSALTVTATSGATSGTVSVTGTSGTLSHNAVVSVTATSPDFILSANPTSLSIRHGNSGSSKITVTPIGGYTGSTTLTASGMPTGMTATFSTNPVRAGSSSTITLATSRTTALGTYTITLTGTSSAAGLTHKITISVTVT